MATSALASPSATLAVLERHGAHTKKRFGQHFLVDDNVVSRIMTLARLAGDDVALEVGPGIGTLTLALCGSGVPVVAVERDDDLLPILAETTAECDRFELISADALDVDLSTLAERFGPPTALVANLPYAVAATVVLRFFEEFPSLRSATVMVQSEVADRMAAQPGTKDFGAYTVKLSLRARATGRFQVARTCFLPPPRVDSAVIRLERVTGGHGPDVVAAASRVADAAFAQRRKTIRNSLRSSLGLDGATLDDALEAAGIDGRVRAETLDPEAFVRLAHALAG